MAPTGRIDRGCTPTINATIELSTKLSSKKLRAKKKEARVTITWSKILVRWYPCGEFP